MELRSIAAVAASKCARTTLLLIALLAGGSGAVHAQATANAITGAGDAFGYRIGAESVGIYDERRVRGFNLEAAGNYRINGYYFVRSSGTSSPLVESVTVGVGRNTFATDLPGPSGVVGYQMKAPAPKRPSQITLNLNTYERPALEWLHNVSNKEGTAGLLGAALVSPDENDFQGGDGHNYLLGAAAKFALGAGSIHMFGIEF